MKHLEHIVFSFLWDGKPDKIARDHVKMSQKEGGLGVTDISAFWNSLKFSWLRRLLKTEAFWPQILTMETQRILGNEIDTVGLMKLGPRMLHSIGKKFENQFWKEVFCTVEPIMQGAIHRHPENLFISPLWDNPLIVRNNKTLKQADYPLLKSLETVTDFFHPNTGKFKTRDELENSMKCIIDMETLTEFHYILNNSRSNVGLPLNTIAVTPFPYQPLLISIANSVKSGCSSYYRFMRSKSSMNSSMSERESKWHQELGCVFSKEFWSRTYKFTSEIVFDNKMKWIQFQICRNSLYTNYKVNKFNRQVSPYCTFCLQRDIDTQNLELVSHIFGQCEVVHGLWAEVRHWVGSLGIILPLDITSLIFGFHEQPITSATNYVILTVKYYIWVSRLKNQNLFLTAYQWYLFKKLDELKNAFIYAKKENIFDPYVILFDSLYAILQEA